MSVPETITALAGLVTAAAVFITAWRTSKSVAVAAEKLAIKTDEHAQVHAERALDVDRKLEIIRVDVNGNLHEMRAALNESLERQRRLERLLGLEEGEEPPAFPDEDPAPLT